MEGDDRRTDGRRHTKEARLAWRPRVPTDSHRLAVCTIAIASTFFAPPPAYLSSTRILHLQGGVTLKTLPVLNYSVPLSFSLSSSYSSSSCSTATTTAATAAAADDVDAVSFRRPSRFLRRANFFATSITHRSPLLAVRSPRSRALFVSVHGSPRVFPLAFFSALPRRRRRLRSFWLFVGERCFFGWGAVSATLVFRADVASCGAGRSAMAGFSEAGTFLWELLSSR